MFARSRLFRTVAPALGLILALGGCGEELGPERMPTAPVRGVVTVGSRPAAGGWVEFVPVEGTVGNVRIARIAPDGTFAADRVPVGRVLLKFDWLDLGGSAVLDPRPFQTFDSPVRRTIPEGPAEPLRVDLLEEAMRARNRRRPGRKRHRRSAKAGGRGGGGDPAGPPPPQREPTIRVVYRDGDGAIHLDWPASRVADAVADEKGTAWVDVEDLDSACNGSVEAMLRDVFKFHPLAIEDALKDTHVPRVDDWGQYVYLVIRTIDFDPDTDALQLHELDVFLGTNYLVTYHNEPAPVLERHRAFIGREPEGRLRRGPSHVLYSLLDGIGDDFLYALEHLDEAVDDLQDRIFEAPDPDSLQEIQRIKRSALRLQRILLPFREAINRLARESYHVIPEGERVYFRDVYDQLVRIHDIADNLRDLISGALSTYLSMVSNRTNDAMKALTIVTVLFLPMTFLVGFFGMNFFGSTLEFRSPELPRAALFWGACFLMFAPPIVLACVAWRRGWLGWGRMD